MSQESYSASEGLAGQVSDISESNLRNQSNIVPQNVDSFVHFHIIGLDKTSLVKFNSLDFWSTQTSSFITKENFCAILQSKLQLGPEYIQNLHLLWGHLILSLMDHISDNASGNIELSWNILPTNHDNGNFFSFLSPDISQTSEILTNDDNFKGIEKIEYQSDEIKWESLLKLAETNSHGPFTKKKKELSLGKWSEGEHRLFDYLITTKYSYGQWKEISSFFPNRSSQQCRSHGTTTAFQERKTSNSKVKKTSSK